jgi:hypothetical protein
MCYSQLTGGGFVREKALAVDNKRIFFDVKKFAVRIF